jgi:hypothetical protein
LKIKGLNIKIGTDYAWYMVRIGVSRTGGKMRKIALIVFILALGFYGSTYAQNYALYFDGSSDYIKVPDSPYNDFSTVVTMEAWVNFTGIGGQQSVIMSKWDAYPQYDMAFTFNARYKYQNEIGFVLCDRTIEYGFGYYMVDLSGNSTVPSNQWTHIAGVFNVDQASVYLNGNFDGGQTSVPEGNGQINQSPESLWIGAVNVSFGHGYDAPSEFFQGAIDEIRIWNYARTQQEIQDSMYYSLTGNEPGLLAYWNFDTGSGQTLYDLTGHTNGQLGSTSGVDSNDPTWVLSDGPYGQQRNVVPEPASLSLLGLGLLGLVFRKTR